MIAFRGCISVIADSPAGSHSFSNIVQLHARLPSASADVPVLFYLVLTVVGL
jgi:hypothetical protein